ncbi:ATP-binding protein [Methylophaga thalassica]|uniref:ATP-binding protein n=1 Tax=Methylophaga thalassica TaxID=40223 RepID=UPI002E7B5B38|nr:ATP-binding protein [Methylophaga thalassica]WVI85659.1 ATP-binding protein [Methylophaga thalassica]
MSINKLRVGDQAVLISREIQQAPIKTVIRELVQNAIEARPEYTDQKRQIEFYINYLELSDGSTVAKIAIKNNGIGMSPDELRLITDLSATAHKTLGKGFNYGIGAKVSGLRSNPAGLRYRSCHKGLVSQVMLIEEEGIYGREKDDYSNEDVFDVTDEYSPFDLMEDWTEVTLFGTNLEDNTMLKPFGNELNVDHNWLNALVHYRYFRLPDNIGVTYRDGVLSETQTTRTLRTWEHIIHSKNQIRTETIDSGQGIKVTYALNNAKGWNVHQIALQACGAIVYKNEMFDVASSNKILSKRWGITAPKLGIPFGSEAISVFIELDDGYPVDMNMYRDQLTNALGEIVHLEEFAYYVAKLMPDWIKAYIDAERNKHNGSSENVRKRIAEMIRSLEIKRDQLRPDSQGLTFSDIEAGTNGLSEGNDSKNTDKKRLSLNAGGMKPAKTASGYENIPDWSFITEKSEIREYGLDGYAATYIGGEGNQLYINTEHRAFKDRLQELRDNFSIEMEDEVGHEIVYKAFQEEYAVNLVFSVIHAKYEWKYNKWDSEELDQATGKSALTVAVSKDYDIVPKVKIRLGANKDLKAINARM